MSPRFKIAYLTLIILFSLAVFLYLLDTWNVLHLRRLVPFIKKEPPIVSDETDNLALIEQERRHKEEERLAEMELRLNEMKARLEEEKNNVGAKQKEYEELRKGLEEEKKKFEESKSNDSKRDKTIGEMARRLNDMPPTDAVEILAGWTDSDIVDVFLRMEKTAEGEGTKSIVPYLLTKMPRDRAALITSLMMDEQARRKPVLAE